MDTISFLIALEEKIAGPSSKAEKALASLQGKIRSSEEAISGLQKKLDTAKAKLEKISETKGVDSSAFKKQSAIVEALSGTLGKAKSDHGLLTTALKKHEDAAASFGQRMIVAHAKLQAFIGLAKMAYAAISAITGPVYGAIKSFAMFALTTADSKRSFMLSLEGAAGGVAAARELKEQIDSASTKYPLATANIKDMARALGLARVGGQTAKDAIESVGLVAAVAGEDAASKFGEIIKKSTAAGQFTLPIKQLAGLGVSVKDIYGEIGKELKTGEASVKGKLKAGTIAVDVGIRAMSRALQTKLGNVGAAMGLGLDSQIAGAKLSFGRLFGGINVEPLLKGLHMVLGLLDTNTATGRALRTMLGNIAQGLIDNVTRAAPIVKAFFQGLVIGALRAYIAAKPTMRALFGATGKSSIETSLTAGESAAIRLGAALDKVLTVMGAIGKAASFVGKLASYVIVDKKIDIANGVDAKSVDTAAMGIGITAGITASLNDSASGPIGAMAALARGMQNAFTTVQEIHSPSRVFARFTRYITGAIVQQAKADTPRVQQSIEGLVETPNAPSIDGYRAGDGAVFNIEINQVFHGSSESTREDAKLGVLDALDIIRDTMGAPSG